MNITEVLKWNRGYVVCIYHEPCLLFHIDVQIESVKHDGGSLDGDPYFPELWAPAPDDSNTFAFAAFVGEYQRGWGKELSL
jgi:hypothetical protein